MSKTNAAFMLPEFLMNLAQHLRILIKVMIMKKPSWVCFQLSKDANQIQKKRKSMNLRWIKRKNLSITHSTATGPLDLGRA